MLFDEVQILPDDESGTHGKAVILAYIQKAGYAVVAFRVFFDAGANKRRIEWLAGRKDFYVVYRHIGGGSPCLGGINT